MAGKREIGAPIFEKIAHQRAYIVDFKCLDRLRVEVAKQIELLKIQAVLIDNNNYPISWNKHCDDVP